MRNIGLLAVVSCLFLTVSCTKDTTASLSESQTPTGVTIVHSVRSAVAGHLLVKFNSEQLPAMSASTVATRSGIEAFDRAVTRAADFQMQRAFPYDAAHEAETHAAGLDCWYELTFDEATDLEALSQQIAACGAVSVVEFACKVKSVDKPIPNDGSIAPARLTEGVQTRTAVGYNDPYVRYQWGYNNTANTSIGVANMLAGADCGCADAWQLTSGDPAIIVAVVDEGVQAAHPDLAANMWVNSKEIAGNGKDDDGNGYVDDINGFNFYANSGTITFDLKADSGHGTHVAGTVAAVNNNSVGVGGVAGGSGLNDGVKIMSCQILSTDSQGESDGANIVQTARAIKYAADNGAVILQNSWGYDVDAFSGDTEYITSNSIEKNAIDYFETNAKLTGVITGGVAIFAAGNDGAAHANYPGAYADYLCVGAYDPALRPTYFTDYGEGVNIFAPGGDVYSDIDSTGKTAGGYTGSYNSAILSTLPTTFAVNGVVAMKGYGFMQGTSQACPHVSGVAALGIAYAKKMGIQLTGRQLRNLLITSANDMSVYCVGAKYYWDKNSKKEDVVYTLNLAPLAANLGAGQLDAFRLLMQIKGTPCLTVRQLGTLNRLSLNKFFGAQSAQLYYTAASVSDADKTKLGIVKCYTQDNMFYFQCTNAGVAMVTVTAVVGANHRVDASMINGATVTREFAVLVRPEMNTNGFWL